MSTVTGRAEIEARLTGIEEVLAGLKATEKGVQQVAEKGTAAEKAYKGVAGALGSMLKTGAAAAGILQGINIAKGVEDAKRLDQVTARFAQSSGLGAANLKSQLEGMEQRTLTAAPAMAELAKHMGRATYDGRAAAGAMGDLADYALATGQELPEMAQSFIALRTGLGVTKDFGDELGRTRDIAERVSVIGGPVAFLDTLTAISGQLAQVNTEAEGARARLESFVAVVGKGLKPDQARQVAGGTLAIMKSRALDLERVTGKRVLDEHGQLLDPGSTLQDLQQLGKKRFGSNKEAMRRAYISEFGPDMGMAIMNFDGAKMESVAATAKDSGKIRAEANSYRGTEAAKREALQLQKQAAERKVGGAFNSVNDFLTDKLGPTGAIATGLALPYAGKLLAAGKGLFGAAAGAGEAGAAAGTAGKAGLGLLGWAGAGIAGMMAGQVAATASLGEDRDVMGKRWRDEHAGAVGAELAQQAVRAGDLNPVIGKAGGDKEVIQAMLVSLEGKFDSLNETLKTQVAAGIAAELRRAPIVMRQPQDPNTPTAKAGN